jgi:hypothetical protein
MRVSGALPAVATLWLIASMSFTGCVGQQPAKPPGSQEGKPNSGMARVPLGASTRHNASVQFFNAYKAHDRAAAREVATDAAINALVFDASAGTNPTLRLVDDSHIYYEGGSIQLTHATNADGRWYVRSVSSRAD